MDAADIRTYVDSLDMNTPPDAWYPGMDQVR